MYNIKFCGFLVAEILGCAFSLLEAYNKEQLTLMLMILSVAGSK